MSAHVRRKVDWRAHLPLLLHNKWIEVVRPAPVSQKVMKYSHYGPLCFHSWGQFGKQTDDVRRSEKSQLCEQEEWIRRGLTMPATWKEKYLVYWNWINIWTSSIKRADSQRLPPLCRLLTLHKSGPEDTSGNQLLQHQTSECPWQKAAQMDHTLYINSVWTYSFSISQASLHMSLLYAFDFSPGRLLCIASNEQKTSSTDAELLTTDC